MDRNKLSPGTVIVSLVFLAAAFSTFASSDILTGQVSVPNAAPTLADVMLYDADLGTIQLTAGSDQNIVYCNGTITDNNGFGDVDVAWAYIYNGSGDDLPAATDKNERYDNASCDLVSGSGVTIVAECAFTIEHEALDGTWTCNITANDSVNAIGKNQGTNDIDTLTGISILESAIDFGTLGLGASSGTGIETNVTNQGNVIVDIRVNGSDYACDVQGTIDVNNTRYDVVDSNWATMTENLTETPMTDTAFDLGIEGIATNEDTNSTKNEFWTIVVPGTGVSGTCTNDIWITGTLDA